MGAKYAHAFEHKVRDKQNTFVAGGHTMQAKYCKFMHD